MPTFTISNSVDNFTLIPNQFVDEYMLNANPMYTVIYIYILRQSFLKNTSIDTKDIAKKINILESDVLNCLDYLQTNNILNLNFVQKIENNSKFINSENNVVKTKFSKDKMPYYPNEEIEIYKKESKELSMLFKVAEKILSKYLSSKDLSTILGFYEWLRLPIDVIEKLLTYCSSIGHTNMLYIEAVAINWAEKGINTIEKSNDYIKKFNTKYKEIFKALGLLGSVPVENQKIFMDRWLDVYNFDIKIICEACNRAVLKTGKPSFEYVEKILKNWHDNSIKNYEEIKYLDDKFQNTKNVVPKSDKNSKTFPKKNKFVNFSPREWDFEKLRKLEREYLNDSIADK